MGQKHLTYDQVQVNAVLLVCATDPTHRWYCTVRKVTCPICRKPTLRKPRAPRPIEGRQS